MSDASEEGGSELRQENEALRNELSVERQRCTDLEKHNRLLEVHFMPMLHMQASTTCAPRVSDHLILPVFLTFSFTGAIFHLKNKLSNFFDHQIYRKCFLIIILLLLLFFLYLKINLSLCARIFSWC